MKDYLTKTTYNSLVEERKKFLNLYILLKKRSEEIIKEERENNEISYFCTASKENETYITFYNINSESLIQVLLAERIYVFDYFLQQIITEVNVDKPEDEYKYKGFRFKYLEEPNFIKQIFDGIDFDETDLIKEMNEEIDFYKDKIIDDKQEMYDYVKTNSILNKYKNEF